MSSSVDQIKSKIDIVSLVSSYMKLEKAGANFKGKCPFHNEKTPSFFVSPDRGSYYCFGCQAKGDIFTFVEEFEGLDFVGALKVLADRAGVTLEKFNKGEKSHKDKLFSIMDQAVFFYQKKLDEDKRAQEYLKKRGIKEETIKEFRLGVSSPEWRDLYTFLKDKGISEGEMLEVGLIKRKEEMGKQPTYYDTFRGRIMFPINDSSGRPVAFSGRILVDEANSPKYLNSPETSLFNKSEILFCLDKAKTEIRQKDYSILVEGQMDGLLLHQIGIKNTVASSGTALTESHLIKLRRLSNRIIMAYDGDSAGFLASNRSAHIALGLGMELKVVQTPQGKDPADLAKDDPTKLKDLLRKSKHIIDFYTDTLLDKELGDRELGQEIRKNVLPYVANLQSTIEKSHFIKEIAKKTFIKEEALWDDLKKIESGGGATENKIESSPPKRRTEAIERQVLGFLFWQKANKSKDPEVKEIDKKVSQILGKKREILEKEFEKEKDATLFEMESYFGGKINLKEEIKELIKRLEEEDLKGELMQTMADLQKAEQKKDKDETQKHLKRFQTISQKLNEIKLTGPVRDYPVNPGQGAKNKNT